MNLDNIKIDGTIKTKKLANGRIVTYMIPNKSDDDPFESFDCKTSIQQGKHKMTELEMIKAFGELDGVNFVECRGKLWVKDEYGRFSINGHGHKEYNPTTDHALTFKAMVDYKVTVEAYDSWGKGVGYNVHIWGVYKHVNIKSEDLPKAIIECILKSKGLWVCQK